MTSQRDQAAWQAMVGTARGVSHNARNIPNQDSAEFGTVGPVGGTVIAVADGHGHERHFRSATGSRLAVQTACRVITELAAELADQSWQAEAVGRLRDQLPWAIAEQWRTAVSADIAAHPFEAGERARLAAEGDGPEIPYGSTLLVALIAADWLVCAQIGDGDLVAIAPDGGAWSPVEGDDLLDGHRTTSLCQPGAESSFRTAAHDLRGQPLLGLLLGTDGYGNSQARDPWQPEVARDIADLSARHDHGWFERQLPVWAERCASASGSGDDTTIALLMAPDSQRLAAAGRPLATTSATGPHTSIVPPAARIAKDDLTVGRFPEAARTASRPGPVPAPPPAPAPRPAAAAAALGPQATVPAAPLPAPGTGAHRRAAPPPARNSRRRAAIGGVAAVVVVGAVVGTVLATQSSGAKPAHPAATPTASHAPNRTGNNSGGNSAPTQAASTKAAPSGTKTKDQHPTGNQKG